MSLLGLAARNLLRSPRRTVLTAVAIIAGVAVFLLGEGFVGGLEENILATAINSQVGHVLARPAGYPVRAGLHPVDRLVELTPEARSLLDAEAVAWTERLYFAPTAASGSDAIRVVAIGYAPERDARVFSRERWKVEGRLPRAGEREVAVSERVARLLGLRVGDPLVLQVRTHRGAMNALEVTVAARVSTGNPAVDMLGVFVPGPLARELVGTALPSHVVARLDEREHAGAFAERLRPALGGGAQVSTWVEETRELLELQAVRRKTLNGVVFILLALAGFGIANTILMAAHERTREVGTLRALGMTEGGVLRLFLLEGALVGLLGSALGALLGGALVSHWARHPLDFSEAFEKQGSSLPISALVYTRFDGAMLAAAVLLGVAVAVLASIYPARVASRLLPADAVRAS